MLRKCHIFQYNTLVSRQRIPSPGAVELLSVLQKRGIPFLILTEQSVRSEKETVSFMESIGFPYFDPKYIYSSTMAAVDWIAREYPHKIKAAYIGGKGMRTALRRANFDLNTQHPDWLFIGYDANATYTDYCYALSLVKNGAVMISTDSSRTTLRENSEKIGSGALVKMLEYASDKKSLEFGRPSVITVASALKYTSYRPDQVVFVGDHFELDILPALKCRMDTVFVAGNSSIYDAKITEDVHPKWIIEDLRGLLR